jgi:formate-dependent nitrite reductase cytochrome c552 subunit
MKKPGILAIALLAGPAIFAWGWIREGGMRLPERAIPDRPIQIAGEGYASSQACKACHPREYASWHASYHRTMTQVASPETIAGDFDHVRVDAVDGRPMLLERRGRQLWAEFDQPDWDGKGNAPPRISRQVVMTTGSHQQQIFWYSTGHDRVLGQLPAIQLLEAPLFSGRWIPRRSATMHPPGLAMFSESGSWNGICVQCHTTEGRPEFNTPYGSEPLFSQKVDTKAVEFGIACEACHGPGGAHARANASPIRRYALHFSGGADPTITQPLRLDPRRSSQVCGQCHSLWEFYDQAGERQANSSGLPYRPGDDLSNTRFIAQPTRNMDSPTMKALLAADPEFVSSIFWSDGMVRATGREYNGLLDSPCYKDARENARTLSCFSCHTMHQDNADARPANEWAAGQVSVGAEDNAACLQCHAGLKNEVPAHTRHRAGSTGSSCYNCHMPYTTYGLLKTIRSHQISSPTVQSTVETGRPNACNLCHLDKTLAWSGEHLQQWYGTPAPALNDDDRTIAASIVTLLKGDAGQRAIIAQAMGWAPAQQVSGTNWMPPYLSLLMNDPYDAVRYITGRSLRSLPGYAELTYDFTAPPERRLAMRTHALERWRDLRPSQGRRTDSQLLFTPEGAFVPDTIDRLMAERDNRRVFYRE